MYLSRGYIAKPFQGDRPHRDSGAAGGRFLSKRSSRRKRTVAKKHRVKITGHIVPVVPPEVLAGEAAQVRPQVEVCPQEIAIAEEPFALPDIGRLTAGEVLSEAAEQMAESKFRVGQLDHRLYLSEEKFSAWREKALLGIIELLDLFRAVLGSFHVREDFQTGQTRSAGRKGKGEPITSEGMANLATVKYRMEEYLRDMGVEEIEARVGAALDIEHHEVFRTVRRKRMESDTVARIVRPGYNLGQRILRKTLVEVVKNP